MTTAGIMENIVHASSNAEEAKREIPLWFEPRELLRSLDPSVARKRAERIPRKT